MYHDIKAQDGIGLLLSKLTGKKIHWEYFCSLRYTVLVYQTQFRSVSGKQAKVAAGGFEPPTKGLLCNYIPYAQIQAIFSTINN